MTDVFLQMAHDAGYRGEEAEMVAAMLEEEEQKRWLSEKLHEQEVWEEEMLREQMENEGDH